MSEILTGSAKGEGVPGVMDMETSVLLSEDEEDIFVLKEGGIPKRPMSTASEEHYFSTPTTIASEKVVSSKTASCMKPGVDGKPNSCKRASLKMQHIWQMQSLSLLKVLSKWNDTRWRPKNGCIISKWKPIRPSQ